MLVKSIKSSALFGKLGASPDKSISHRAIIVASLTLGVSYIHNLLWSEDTAITLSWAKSIGVSFKKVNNVLEVSSNINISSNIQHNNEYTFYLGNSGTSARLLMGVMAGLGGTSLFYGDASLNKRPMLRIIDPLVAMNAEILTVVNIDESIKKNLNSINVNKNLKLLRGESFINQLRVSSKINSKNDKLPLIIKSKKLKGINYTLNIASAQVKSAVLLAGLFTEDRTVVTEMYPTRDHTENMLKSAGVDLTIEMNSNGTKTITLPQGKKCLNPCNWYIPGDFSSVAFIIVAALIVPNSSILIRNVNLNPLRTGLLKVLIHMGANICIIENQEVCNEKNGDLLVKYTEKLKPVKPVVINKELVPLMIDEFPILACLVSLINGESKFLGIEELKYKESDRILTIVTNLNRLGIKTLSTKDSLTIYGDSKVINHSTIIIDPQLDHRIAMSFLILGLVMVNGIIIKNAEVIHTSFPKFISTLQSMGANVISIN